MLVKDLLLALNMKSQKQGFTYVAQFNYQYSQTYRQMYTKELLLEYNNSKLINKIRIKGETHLVQVLTELLTKYTNSEK